MKKCSVAFYFSENLNRNKKAIESLSMFVPKCTCLVQAMAFKILSPSDSRIKLVIGIAKKDKFKSHAWVCMNDDIVFGGSANAAEFTKLVDF